LNDKNELDELEQAVEDTFFTDKGMKIAAHQANESDYKEQLMALDYGANWADLDKEALASTEKISINLKNRTKVLEDMLVDAEEAGPKFKQLEKELCDISDWLGEYDKINQLRLKESRSIKRLRDPAVIQIKLIDSINKFSSDEVKEAVLSLLFQQIESLFIKSSVIQRNHVTQVLVSMLERYQINLREIEESGAKAQHGLDDFLGELGYEI